MTILLLMLIAIANGLFHVQIGMWVWCLIVPAVILDVSLFFVTQS